MSGIVERIRKKWSVRARKHLDKRENIRSMRFFFIVSWLNADPALAKSVKAILNIYGEESK